MNLVKFQSGLGKSVESFLPILEIYLKSMVVEYEERKYKKEGVCIGSSVAPILAYKFTLDRTVHDNPQGLSRGMATVRGYVDDILVCTFTEGLSESIQHVMRSTATELKFTVEKPEEDVLQYLDLRIHVNRGLCWEYGRGNFIPVLAKNELSFEDRKGWGCKVIGQERIRKIMCPSYHLTGRKAVKIVIRVGYDDSFIKRQLELFIKGRRHTKQKSRNRFAVNPYFHEISHNLKACARQFVVDTVFSSDFRLSKLTPFQTGVSECKKTHREKIDLLRDWCCV